MDKIQTLIVDAKVCLETCNTNVRTGTENEVRRVKECGYPVRVHSFRWSLVTDTMIGSASTTSVDDTVPFVHPRKIALAVIRNCLVHMTLNKS